MIETTLGKVIESMQVLKLMNLNPETPGKLSFKVNKIVSKLKEEVDAYNEVRNKRVKDLGEVNKDGFHAVKKENIEHFLLEMAELEKQEIKIDFEKIKEIEFGEKPHFAPILCGWLIEE